MFSETVWYKHKETACKGQIFYDVTAQEKKPAIIVAHAWRGQDSFAREKAQALTELGYIGFAADLYGDGKEVQTDEEAAFLMLPLFYDRALLQERLKAAFDAVREHPKVDPQRIGGIGFCFGGLAIIELFRSGVDLRGAVGFHAVLGDEKGGQKATTVPIASGIKGSLLCLHGHEDPLVSASDITTFQNELTKANVDWQMHIYGHTSHAFTNPQANNKGAGLLYQPKAAKRSWQAMINFFSEVFC